MFSRLLQRISGLAVGLILLAPIVSLPVAAAFDIGPEGQVRFSLFPLVLTLYDPLFATSLGQSVAMAAAIAAASAIVGGGLGGLLGVRRFWGRPVFEHVLGSIAVLPPAFLALGVVGLRGLFEAGTASSLADATNGYSAQFPLGWRWAAWAWVGAIPWSAMVLDATVQGLRQLEPDWGAAARLAGATRWRVQLDITWPRIRPRILAVCLACFVQTLADPGPALILGLRRTLGFQLVSAALGADPFPRLAAVSLFTFLVAFLVRSIWGLRASSLASTGSRATSGEAAGWGCWVETDSSTWRRVAAALILSLAVALSWLPAAGLVRLSLIQPSGTMHGGDAFTELAEPRGTPLLGILGRSLGLAVAFGFVLFISARIMPRHRPGPRAARLRAAVRLTWESTPPLLLGVGVLSFFRVLSLAGTWLGGGENESRGSLLLALIGLIQRDRTEFHGLLVIFGVCLAYVPIHLLRPRDDEADPETCEHRIEQARLMGAGRARSLELAQAGMRAIPLRQLILWSVLASTSVAPAIVLCGLDPTWSIGPAVVSLVEGPGPCLRQAAWLALGTMSLSLLAWGFARSRA